MTKRELALPSQAHCLAVVLGVACSGPGASNPTLEADSSGVLISESRRPDAPGRLAINASEIVDIGGKNDTNPQVEFIGPVSAIRLPTGEIVAAGWAANELRFFSPSGIWLRNIGARGSGPGEFEALGSVYLARDGTLVVYEPLSRRIQFFDSTGTFQRLTFLVASPDEGSPSVVGVLSVSTLLVVTNSAVDSANAGPLIPNRHRYYRYDLATGDFALLFEMPGPVYIRHPVNPQHRIGILPFAQQGLVTAAGGAILSTTRSGFGIDIRDSVGIIRRSVRRVFEARRLADADRSRAAVEATTDMAPSLAAVVRKVISSATVPVVAPFGAAIVMAPSGTIFVQHFGGPAHPGSKDVTVFAPDGRWVQDLSLPRPAILTQAGDDFLLGTYADAEGFHHLVVYTLMSVGLEKR